MLLDNKIDDAKQFSESISSSINSIRAEIQTYVDTNAVVREGWEILVKNLGLLKATQFVVLRERGKGDSVKKIAEYWGEATTEEIHNRVIDWAAKAKSINKRGER